jgi:hypothetical protein
VVDYLNQLRGNYNARQCDWLTVTAISTCKRMAQGQRGLSR